MSELIMAESATPSTPSTGKVKLFAPTQTVPTIGVLDDAGVLGKIAFSVAATLTVGATGTAALISTGNWTPTIRGHTTAGAHTYSTQVGNYIKIGTLVIAWFNVAINAKDAAMVGNAQIAGLPFTSKTVAGLVYSGANQYWSTLATSCVFVGMYVDSNSAVAAIVRATAATATTGAMVTADVQNGSQFAGTLMYEAAA